VSETEPKLLWPRGEDGVARVEGAILHTARSGLICAARRHPAQAAFPQVNEQLLMEDGLTREIAATGDPPCRELYDAYPSLSSSCLTRHSSMKCRTYGALASRGALT
jgi:hypothetical protein